MGEFNRRAFLRGAAATTGGVLVGGPLQALVASAAGARPPSRFLELGPVADLRDGRVRLHVPPGFQYRSFHDNDGPAIVLDDGTTLPGRHDGMASFPGQNGNVWLVRNHEVNGPVGAFGPGTPYDAMTGGGTTTVLVTPFGEVLTAFTSLNGSQMNCAGGPVPWGSWITCEETVNGPDVGSDFTGASNVDLEQPHGFLFEVPAGGQSTRVPIRKAGRFAHEAAAFSPDEGIMYLTEDNFGFPSGLFRYIPPTNPMETGSLDDGGTLQMLRVVGEDDKDLAVQQQIGAKYLVDWVDIQDPDPEFDFTPGQPAPTSNNDAIVFVGNQGREQGAAWFSRLEGTSFVKGEIYFVATQGGGAAEGAFGPIGNGYGNGTGQVWSYNPRTQTLTCRHQAPEEPEFEQLRDLDGPDNITARNNRGSIVICEDGPVNNFIRGLTRDGQLFDIVLNQLTRNEHPHAPRFGEEFAGATFSPDGGTLFVNTQASDGITYAIWGPWGRIGI